MKKKKCGYAYLKEKVAKLQEENSTLVQHLNDERAKLSNANAKYGELDDECLLTKNALGKEHADRVKAENDLMREIEKNKRFADAATKAQKFFGERYVWLYEHAPFWVKWQFKKTFNDAVK